MERPVSEEALSSLESPTFKDKSNKTPTDSELEVISQRTEEEKENERQAILKRCIEQYNSDLNTDEWEPIIENQENMRAYLKQCSGNEFEFHFELKFPDVDKDNMWFAHTCKNRLKHDIKMMKNFQVLEDRGENGIITYHEKETQVPIMKKRELVSEMWKAQDAFGTGKHVLWQHST